MWFSVPTPPFIVDGVEQGSARNRRFALRGKEQEEYLTFEADGVNLRRNYLDIMNATRDQLATGLAAAKLFGPIDEPKLRSSVRLFERLSRAAADEELHSVLADVLGLLGEEPDRGETIPGHEF